MAHEYIEINIESLKNGAVAERFNDAIARIIENVMDKNTDYKVNRKVVISLSMKPNEDRDLISTTIDVKTTLAPPKVLQTMIAIGRNGETVGATEVGQQLVGQRKIDVETGEIVEVGNKLIEMQSRAAGGK